MWLQKRRNRIYLPVSKVSIPPNWNMPKLKRKIPCPIKMVIVFFFYFSYHLVRDMFFLFIHYSIISYFLFLFGWPVIIAEKIHDSILNGVEHFEKSSMHHVVTEEHNPLPTVEGLLFWGCQRRYFVCGKIFPCIVVLWW